MKGQNQDDKIFKKNILQGKIFVYQTDTICGLGCNAEDKKAVEKIRQIKKRGNC